ncbi:MAG: molybdopterin-binding/glycosyltransferase family 2 protein [Hyphomicrobiales bacterium]
MKLINLPTERAVGNYLAHAQNGLVDGSPVRIKKGTLLDSADVEALSANGHTQITVAQLSPGDVHEDKAAFELASEICGDHIRVDPPFTGRANLFAKHAGLFIPDTDLVNQINSIDPSITAATLPAFTSVAAGRMVATVKIIPFAVTGSSLSACLKSASENVVALAPYSPARVGLVATTLPTLKPSVMDKTRTILDKRLVASRSSVSEEIRTSHDVASVSAAILNIAKDSPDIIVLFGASAMIDGSDVLPEALRHAGGEVIYVGMPVDPGNLLFLGALNSIPVIGAPGCARSPVENGFDWILNRALARQTISPKDIATMGVGGLLMEITSRPQPRDGFGSDPNPAPSVAAIVLAAGQSKRMGANNKLVAELDGSALVHHVVRAARDSRISKTVLVTGAEPEKIRAAVAEFEIDVAHNREFDDGLSTSLRTGLRALIDDPVQPDAAIVLLGDMPRISQPMIDKLVSAFDPIKGREIIVPTNNGKRGNPVVWSARFFDQLMDVKGDTGGRHLVGEFSEFVHEVEIGEAASFDLDTPEALLNAGGQLTD